MSKSNINPSPTLAYTKISSRVLTLGDFNKVGTLKDSFPNFPQTWTDPSIARAADPERPQETAFICF